MATTLADWDDLGSIFPFDGNPKNVLPFRASVLDIMSKLIVKYGCERESFIFYTIANKLTGKIKQQYLAYDPNFRSIFKFLYEITEQCNNINLVNETWSQITTITQTCNETVEQYSIRAYNLRCRFFFTLKRAIITTVEEIFNIDAKIVIYYLLGLHHPINFQIVHNVLPDNWVHAIKVALYSEVIQEACNIITLENFQDYFLLILDSVFLPSATYTKEFENNIATNSAEFFTHENEDPSITNKASNSEEDDLIRFDDSENTVTEEFENNIATSSAEFFNRKNESLSITNKELNLEEIDLIQLDDVKTNISQKLETEPMQSREVSEISVEPNLCEKKKTIHEYEGSLTFCAYSFPDIIVNRDVPKEIRQQNDTQRKEEELCKQYGKEILQCDAIETFRQESTETIKPDAQYVQKGIHDSSSSLNIKSNPIFSPYQRLEPPLAKLKENDNLQSDDTRTSISSKLYRPSNTLHTQFYQEPNWQATSAIDKMRSAYTPVNKILGLYLISKARPPREKPPWILQNTTATICPQGIAEFRNSVAQLDCEVSARQVIILGIAKFSNISVH